MSGVPAMGLVTPRGSDRTTGRSTSSIQHTLKAPFAMVITGTPISVLGPVFSSPAIRNPMSCTVR